MTVVLVSPDYLSHYRPLSVLARAVRLAGERVVVATGRSLHPQVDADGFEWRELRLGAASNPGVAAADDSAIDGFISATRDGPLETIAFQARKREHDLLWEPRRVAAGLHAILDELSPEHLVVDHVSFASTLAARATGRPFTTLVPGHPTQLPVGDERYGLPPSWPLGLRPRRHELITLERLLDRVGRGFTERWNEVFQSLRPGAAAVEDAYRVCGHRVLHNTVATLMDPERRSRLNRDRDQRHHFVGPLITTDAEDPGDGSSWWGGKPRRPRVYVAFGTFLAHRGDVLAKVAEGLRQAGAQAAIAIGPNEPERLGPIPNDWLIGATLPQVGLLRGADIAISHGGNNSVQEALAAGCHQIVLPFSTDQFANAADLEQRAGATVLAPNTVRPADIADAIERLADQVTPLPVRRCSAAELATALLG